MKVQLIVVQGKPEGKSIPLAGPSFKIGRGETCHLRPNSEMVSREHSEISIAGDRVTVKDLGSRNGTLLNGKALTKEEQVRNGDLIQIGPLTFAVSIEGVPAPATKAQGGRPGSLDEAQQDDIDSWLVADNANPTPDRPSGVYGGETMTLETYQQSKGTKPPSQKPAKPSPQSQKPAAPKPDPEPDPEPEPEPIEEEADEESPEDYLDESNPFHVKKAAPQPAGPAKPAKPELDSSSAADQILRRMMDRRRGSR